MNQIFYNGKFIPEEDVKISIRSKVVNYGLGIFEGIRAYWDDETEQLYAFHLKAHYKRFIDNAKIVNCEVPYTVDELVEITKELLRKNGKKESTYIRPLAFKNGEEIGFSIIGHEHDVVAIYSQPLLKYMSHEEFNIGISSWKRTTSFPRTV